MRFGESKMSASGFHRWFPKRLTAALLVGAFAALLFTAVAAATAPLAGWFGVSSPDGAQSAGHKKEAEEPASVEPVEEARSRKCKHCGIIESIRQVGPLHEVTVRLSDRSTHVFSDAHPASWRPGERIILIGGGISPRR